MAPARGEILITSHPPIDKVSKTQKWATFANFFDDGPRQTVDLVFGKRAAAIPLLCVYRGIVHGDEVQRRGQVRNGCV